jgi:hypothetical protein
MKTMAQRKKILRFIILATFFIAVFFLNFEFVAASIPSLLDFGSFIASGQLATLGKNPYSLESPLIFFISFSQKGPAGYAPNLNPPISVLMFKPLANIDPILSVNLWRC